MECTIVYKRVQSVILLAWPLFTVLVAYCPFINVSSSNANILGFPLTNKFQSIEADVFKILLQMSFAIVECQFFAREITDASLNSVNSMHFCFS